MRTPARTRRNALWPLLRWPLVRLAEHIGACVVSGTIRSRTLSHLQMVTGKFPDDDLHDAGEVFYYVGGKSWPTFVREIKRMERDGLIEINRDVDEDDDVWISLIPDPDSRGAT